MQRARRDPASQVARLLLQPAAERPVEAEQEHAAPATDGAPRGLDRQQRLARAGRSVEDDARVEVDRVQGLELLLGEVAHLLLGAQQTRLGALEELEVRAQEAGQRVALLPRGLSPFGVEPRDVALDQPLAGVAEHVADEPRDGLRLQRAAVDHLPVVPLRRGLGEVDEREADRRAERDVAQLGVLPGQAPAQAVHGLGGLAEGTAMVGLGATPVVPVAAVAAQRVAAFDLDHEHALPGHQTEEVDLAGEPPPVVGDVEGVEDGPAGGVRACGRTAGPPAATAAPRAVRRSGERLEHGALAVTLGGLADGRRDEAHGHLVARRVASSYRERPPTNRRGPGIRPYSTTSDTGG